MPYKVYQTPAVQPKVEPAAAEVEMADAAGANGNGTAEKTKKLPPWLTKAKEAGVAKKVPKKVLKQRRNFMLKRMLAPKPPCVLLYEVVGASEIKFGAFEVDKVSHMLKVEATYDGKTFEGVGPSKSIAKNICAEHVLQHYVFKSCTKVKTEDGDVEMTDETAAEGGRREDPTPWSALASLGLFKLFNDWQAKGAQLPAELLQMPGMRPPGPPAMSTNPLLAPEVAAVPAAAIKKEKKPKEVKEKQLPENPHMHHPVMLLNQMCGQLEYECVVDGIPPQALYKMTVKVNGSEFMGVSKNKKDAKKLAAQAAMASVFHVQYPVA